VQDGTSPGAGKPLPLFMMESGDASVWFEADAQFEMNCALRSVAKLAKQIRAEPIERARQRIIVMVVQ
jgi:hypothetical protein